MILLLNRLLRLKKRGRGMMSKVWSVDIGHAIILHFFAGGL